MFTRPWMRSMARTKMFCRYTVFDDPTGPGPESPAELFRGISCRYARRVTPPYW